MSSGAALRIDVLTLFPEVFPAYLQASIPGRAVAAGLVQVHLHNIRDYTENRHGKVDDRPFGGGPGMLLACQPVLSCLDAVLAQDARPGRRIVFSAAGERLSQGRVEALAREDRLILLAGHYEGMDQRAIDLGGFEELSIGDYVLSGGELAGLVLMDAVIRQLPDALGHEAGASDESFSTRMGGLLEPPQYTRPRVFRGVAVPEILLSGDHGRIEAWKRAESLARTRERRPDLLAGDEGGPEGADDLG